MAEEIEVLPDPKRLIEGLRDTGYEFVTAVADIIDNSIAAEATLVDLVFDMDFRGNVRLSIADTPRYTGEFAARMTSTAIA